MKKIFIFIFAVVMSFSVIAEQHSYQIKGVINNSSNPNLEIGDDVLITLSYDTDATLVDSHDTWSNYYDNSQHSYFTLSTDGYGASANQGIQIFVDASAEYGYKSVSFDPTNLHSLSNDENKISGFNVHFHTDVSDPDSSSNVDINNSHKNVQVWFNDETNVEVFVKSVDHHYLPRYTAHVTATPRKTVLNGGGRVYFERKTDNYNSEDLRVKIYQTIEHVNGSVYTTSSQNKTVVSGESLIQNSYINVKDSWPLGAYKVTTHVSTADGAVASDSFIFTKF